MRLATSFTAVLLFATCAFGLDCAVSLKDSKEGVEAVVDSCSNVGTYSLGALYDGSWMKLTYHYPEPWKGTFTTFQVDDRLFCTSNQPRNCTFTDDYVSRKPQVSGGALSTSWMLGQVRVTQSLSLSTNTTKLTYSFENVGTENHTVAARLHIDTMLGLNDGAPIYVPSEGLLSVEGEYDLKDHGFEYFKAYNHPTNPSIVVTGSFDPKNGLTYPKRLVLADWKKSKDSAWDYTPKGRTITYDSAVLLYYQPKELAPAQEHSIAFTLSSEEPVITSEQGPMGLAEITLDKVSGRYCPGDVADFTVDVLSTEVGQEVTVGLQVSDGNIIYYSENVTRFLEKDELTSIGYTWTVPNLNQSISLDVSALLYNSTGVQDVRGREDAVVVDLEGCGFPVVQVGKEVFAGFFLLVFVAVASAILIGLAYLWLNRGDVEFTKYVNGEDVTVKVINDTRRTLKDVVIEDTIPPQAEITVKTLNVLRRQNSLKWVVGSLAPGEDALLEYQVKDVPPIVESHLSWDRGQRRLK